MTQGNQVAPDGYQYGVMFSDGSVAVCWTGRTQRERAAAFAAERAVRFAPDHITLARRRPGEPWERVEQVERKVVTRSVSWAVEAADRCRACGSQTETHQPGCVTRRGYLAMMAVANGADVLAAVEAVASTAIEHPEWDMGERKMFLDWQAG